jgi:hypothetical protein
VIGEEELHDALARLVDERRVRLDNHAWLHRPRARRDWLGSPLHLDQTHTAVTGNHQLLVVAVSRDGASGLLACLDEGGTSCSGASGRALQLRAGISEASYLQLRPSFHLRRTVSGRGRGQMGVAQTDCELDLCRPGGRGSKSPAAIESCAAGRLPQRPDQLLPQHVGGVGRGRWGVVLRAFELPSTSR